MTKLNATINIVGCEELSITGERENVTKMLNAFFDVEDMFASTEVEELAKEETYAQVGDCHIVFFSMDV